MQDFVKENKFAVVAIALVGIVLTLPLWAPLVNRGSAPPPPKAAAKPEKPKPPDIPPLLNEGNLTGSVWEVEPKPGIKIKVTLNPGGQAVAMTDNPLVKQLAGTSTLPGTWRVSGAKLHVATKFQGKDIATDLVIAGDKIYADGVPIPRLR